MTSVGRGDAERFSSKVTQGDVWREDRGRPAITDPILRKIITIAEKYASRKKRKGIPEDTQQERGENPLKQIRRLEVGMALDFSSRAETLFYERILRHSD